MWPDGQTHGASNVRWSLVSDVELLRSLVVDSEVR